MYGDENRVIETELSRQNQQAPDFAQDILFSAEETGEGMSPTRQSKDEDASIRETVARRLVRARKAAGFKELDVAIALNHSNRTMISLFENGHRPPSLQNLILLSDLYSVTTDYLLGRTDDIGLAPEEGNQALVMGAIRGVMTGHVEKFLEGIARVTAVSVEGLSMDRVLLNRHAELTSELVSAFEVIQKHHGEVFNELRGGSKVQRLIEELAESMRDRIRSKHLEKALCDYEHPICNAKQIESAVQIALFGEPEQ